MSDFELVSEKDPGVDKTYELDVFLAIIDEVQRNYEYAQGAVLKPTIDNGFYIQCLTAGRTGRFNPYSPRQANQLIKDGSTEWISKHPSEVTPIEISSVTWSFDPAGELSVASQSESGQVATVTFADGENDVDYEVTARVIPSSGDSFDITIVVPVRNQ